MGVRVKVTLTLVIIALTQIACRHCMPKTTRKASLKRYLNDLKPVKDDPVPTPFSPSRVNKIPNKTFGKAAKNARISQNFFPKKSIYETYNFPENEYPLDTSPRDPFHSGMNFNVNYQVNTPQKDFLNLQGSVINDLKKEIRMKRKLLRNTQMNNQNAQPERKMSSVKFTSASDSIRLLDSETFPEVQYPLNTLETWVPNYWNYLPFIEDKQFDGFGHQTFIPKVNKEGVKKPFTRLTKATASQFLKSYDKLKEEQRLTSTKSSKRSNIGQKGLNFTKTTTCERTSDDFITAGMISSILRNSSDTTKTLESSSETTLSSKNTCPITEYAYNVVPIPYKVIEENTKNICQVNELKNNTKELEDMNNSVIAQTLQLIQDILFIDDTSLTVPPGNFSKEIKKYTTEYIDVPEKEDIPNALMNSAKSRVVSPSEELSQAVSDDALSAISQKNMPSLPAEILQENTTIGAGPLNVRMPLPITEPTYGAFTNVPSSGPINKEPLSNGNVTPSSTSVIIIPINNNVVGKSQSHMFETIPDTPIVVYIPSTKSSSFRSQTLPYSQYVSSSVDKTLPNNELHNVLYNMAPLQDDNPFSTALVNELLNGISNSESSLPMYETLPTNSMCDNNENSPSSMKAKPFKNNAIYQLLTDTAASTTPTCNEKLLNNQSTETCSFNRNTETLPSTPDFEHPFIKFDSFLSHGPYNNILTNELPIIAREISFDQKITNDLYTPKHNITLEHLNKNASDHDLQISMNKNSEAAATVALNNDLTLETPTNSLETCDNHTFIPAPLPEPLRLPLSMNKTLLFTLISEKLTDHLPTSINKTLPLSSDSEILPLPMNMPITTSKPSTDSLPLPVNKALLSLPVTDSPFDSLRVQVHKALPPTQVDDTAMNNLSAPIDKSLFPNSLESYDFPQLSMDKTVLPTPVSEDRTDKTYLMDNLAIPLSKAVTTRTKGPPTNGLPYTKYDLPFKIDVVSPDLFQFSSNDLPLSVNDIPITVHQNFTKNTTAGPTNDFPVQVDEIKSSPLSEVSVNDKPNLTNELPLPVDEILETITSGVPMDGVAIPIIYNSVSSDEMPESLPSADSQPQNKQLPLPIGKLITGFSHSDTLTNEPILIDDSSLSVNDKVTEIPQSDTQDLPVLVDDSRSPKDDEVMDTLIHDISSTKSWALIKGLQTNYPNETNDEALLDSTLSEEDHGDLSLLMDKLLPLPEDTPSNLPLTSKLPLTKALLDNVLSGITTGSFLSPAKPLLVTPPSLLDKTLYSVDIESPHFESAPLPVNKVLSDTALSENLNGNSPLSDLEAHLDTPILNIPTELLLPMDEIYNEKSDILTGDVEDQVKNETQSSDTSAEDLQLPANKILLAKDSPSGNSLPKNKTFASKLPMTEALLEKKLSDINIKDSLSPVAKTLPVISTSVLDKTLYYLESPLPDIARDTRDNPLEAVDKILPNTVLSEMLTEISNLDISTELSSSMDMIRPDDDPDLPDILMFDKEQDENNNPPSENSTDNLSSDTFSLHNDRPAELPLPYNKTHSTTKLQMTKAVLENVLSKIDKKDFSLPVAKAVPVASRSRLDKTLYFLESTFSDMTKNSSLFLVDKILPLLADNLILDISIDELSMDKKHKDKSDIRSVNVEVEDISETPSSDNPSDDLSTQVDEKFSLTNDMRNDSLLPRTKPHLTSRIPITKVLFEKVLSDIIDGGSASKVLPNKILRND